MKSRSQKIIVVAVFTVLICLIMGFCTETGKNLVMEGNRSTKVIRPARKTLLVFYSDKCPACHKIYGQAIHAKDWQSGGENIYFINLKGSGNQHYIGEYHLKYVPTFIYLEDGTEKERYVGDNQKKVQKMLEKVKE